MKYDELVATIQSYTENTFPETYLASGATVSSTMQLNTFITQAEQRIHNTLQFPSLRKTSTLTTTAASQYLDCPNDFLATYSMAVMGATGYTFLLNKDVSFIRQAYPLPTDTATPQYYALFGPQAASALELRFILGPTPDAVYSIELQYLFEPESITTAAGGQTWLGDNFDSVLLYGSLVEAYTFMKGEPDIIAGYDARYKDALALAKRLGDGLERSDAYRSGQYREPPLPQTSGVR
jgi:hypothetical protein